MLDKLMDALKARFGTAPALGDAPKNADVLAEMANRRVIRRYTDQPVDAALLETLCAVALSAPSKSDLQQADIVIVSDKGQREKLEALLPDNPWVKAAPVFLVFCGNNRRQRLWHGWHDIPFANDHLDAFFNASVDAGIALSAFVLAAEVQGLGTCPISVIRNHAARISALLKLPPHVFPVAGLGVGWPVRVARQSFRLPLAVTVHRDTYNEDGLRDAIEGYDRRREAAQPYGQQRYVERFGRAAQYGWSQDKARQYAVPERADFGAYVRERGFKLD